MNISFNYDWWSKCITVLITEVMPLSTTSTLRSSTKRSDEITASNIMCRRRGARNISISVGYLQNITKLTLQDIVARTLNILLSHTYERSLNPWIWHRQSLESLRAFTRTLAFKLWGPPFLQASRGTRDL